MLRWIKNLFLVTKWGILFLRNYWIWKCENVTKIREIGEIREFCLPSQLQSTTWISLTSIWQFLVRNVLILQPSSQILFGYLVCQYTPTRYAQVDKDKTRFSRTRLEFENSSRSFVYCEVIQIKATLDVVFYVITWIKARNLKIDCYTEFQTKIDMNLIFFKKFF